MEYVYAALLLHSAKNTITEENIAKVTQSAGISPDVTKIKALVASLEGQDIDTLIKQAAVVSAAPVQAAEKKEEKKEDEGKKSEEAAAGLASLFG